MGMPARFISKHRAWILLFWLLSALLSAIGAAQFMSITTLSFDAPKGYPSYKANEDMQRLFPDLVKSSSFVGLVAVQPPAKALELPGLRNFSFALQQALNDTHPLVSFQSNATLWYEVGIPASAGLVSQDGSVTLLQWVVSSSPTSVAGRHFADQCDSIWQREVHRWLSDVKEAGIVSVPTLINLGITDSEKSLAEMDAIALPIAVLVLWYVVQSGRLLLFPLVTVGCSASVSFGVMYLVGQFTVVETTTPSLMMSLLIAMSIDYSLFFLTRFRQELMVVSVAETGDEAVDAAAKVNAAIESTMQTAGFTILLSGVTLTASFLTVAFFPVVIISSLGVGCAFSLTIALFVHLTAGPALLAFFPKFFVRCVSQGGTGSSCRCWSQCCRRSLAASSAGRDLLRTDGTPTQGGRASSTARCWQWLAKMTTTPCYAISILFVVTVGTLVIGLPALEMKTADNLMMSCPRGTQLYNVYNLLIEKFGAGGISPYRVLMETKGGSSVLQESLWQDVQTILQEMQSKLPFMSDAQVLGMSYSNGVAIPWAMAQGCLQHSQAPSCNVILFAINAFSNSDRSATYAQLTLSFDPLGVHGPDWLDQARSLLVDLEGRTGFNLSLNGVCGDSLDIISSVYDVFPYMVVFTLAAALFLLGIAFRSILIPLRSVLSICLTLSWVYGTSTQVYQNGALDWLQLPGMSGQYHAQEWMLPVICFSIVVGICLDYDIFLLTRVSEFREGKMGARASIQEGLCSTGGIISAAGLIMAIAFAGLLFSSTFAVNGLAFYMVVAVLYDTLVVRCLLTPAAMALLDRFNWWPSTLSQRGHEQRVAACAAAADDAAQASASALRA